MVRSIRYRLSDPDERTEKYVEVLADILLAYYKRASAEAIALFESRRGFYEESFCRAFQKAEEFLKVAAGSQQKGKITYIHLSYLLSGALSGEQLIKMDFYDARHYRDVEETDCFWDYSGLFPSYDRERKDAEAELRRRIVRMQSGELSRIGIGMTACGALALKPILKELAASREFLRNIRHYCGCPAYILYGAYLDEAELLYQIEIE